MQKGVTMIEINYVYRLYRNEKVTAKKVTREWQSRVIFHKKNPIFMRKPYKTVQKRLVIANSSPPRKSTTKMQHRGVSQYHDLRKVAKNNI